MAGAAVLIAGDVGKRSFCVRRRASDTSQQLGASTSWSTMPPSSIRKRVSQDITPDQLERTFRTNIFSCFFVTKRRFASARRERDHQHDFRHRLSRQPAPARLRRDEGRDRRVHALLVTSARGTRQIRRQRRGAGPDLDSADSRLRFPPTRSRPLAPTCRSAEPASRTRSRPATCSSHRGDVSVHDGPGPASERRRDHQWLNSQRTATVPAHKQPRCAGAAHATAGPHWVEGHVEQRVRGGEQRAPDLLSTLRNTSPAWPRLGVTALSPHGGRPGSGGWCAGSRSSSLRSGGAYDWRTRRAGTGVCCAGATAASVTATATAAIVAAVLKPGTLDSL